MTTTPQRGLVELRTASRAVGVAIGGEAMLRGLVLLRAYVARSISSIVKDSSIVKSRLSAESCLTGG